MKNHVPIFVSENEIGGIVHHKANCTDAYVNDKGFRSAECEYSLTQSCKIQEKLFFYDYAMYAVGIFSIKTGEVLVIEKITDFEYLGQYDDDHWVYATADCIKTVNYHGVVREIQREHSGRVVMIDEICSVWDHDQKHLIYKNHQSFSIPRRGCIALIKRVNNLVYLAEYLGNLKVIDLNSLECIHEYLPDQNGQVIDALKIADELIVAYYFFGDAITSYIDLFHITNCAKMTSQVKCGGDLIISSDGNELLYRTGERFSTFTGKKIGRFLF